MTDAATTLAQEINTYLASAVTPALEPLLVVEVPRTLLKEAADMLLELARDGERLDWLEGRLDGTYLTERFFDSDDRKALVRRWTADHRDWYDTPRAAIDSARAATEGEK